MAAQFYGLIPNVVQGLASYNVYHWGCAARTSGIMGLVGPGGLGHLMDQSMEILNDGESSCNLQGFLLVLRKTLA